MKRLAKPPKRVPVQSDHGTLYTEIKNHDNDPVVIKKVEKARDTILRVGFPEINKK
jgi:hypothetical protein